MLHKDTREGGLYIIQLSDTHYYGGRARDFKGRWRAHLRELRAGVHDNPRMQAVYNIYGRFEPNVLRRLPDEELEAAEQAWLDENFRKPGCVNLSPISTGGCGGHTEETRRKMSATRAARPDLVAKARAALAVNRLHIDPRKMVAKAKMLSEGNRGKKQSPESVEKRATANRGRKNTAETRSLMSESAKSRAVLHPTTHGEDTRALISEQQRGRVWINDGVRNQRVFPDDVPAGWARGRLPLGRR